MNTESAAGEISLRPETPADEALLYELYADTRAGEMAMVNWDSALKEAFVRMQFVAQRKGYREMFPRAAFSIILEAGQPIGRMVVDRAAGEIRLVDLVLQPACRGRGLGTRLLSGLCSEADTEKKPLRLHVLRGNRARRLYERLGFFPKNQTEAYEEMERPART